jgi:hypothetical protein
MKIDSQGSALLGQQFIDLYHLCSDEIQVHKTELIFESKENDVKIQFEMEMTSDTPMLKVPKVNCLYVTFDAICNIEETEKSSLSIGMKVPFGSEVHNKNLN